MLTDCDVDAFVEQGFVRVAGAFPRSLADECRARLWAATGCDPDDQATWTAPVVRLDYRSDAPFVEAVNTPTLHRAFDRIVGEGRWHPRPNLGTFPIRFPHPGDPGDDGWHVDASFLPPGVDAADYLHYRLNLWSDGRALVLLLLFSDVGVDDAPTRLRVGSHLALPKCLEPFGRDGTDVFDLMPLPEGDVALATGDAGDVYLCHPFLVHAAQCHRGSVPRFLAQPPLHPAVPFELERADGVYSPVEQAIRLGLSREQP